MTITVAAVSPALDPALDPAFERPLGGRPPPPGGSRRALQRGDREPVTSAGWSSGSPRTLSSSSKASRSAHSPADRPSRAPTATSRRMTRWPSSLPRNGRMARSSRATAVAPTTGVRRARCGSRGGATNRATGRHVRSAGDCLGLRDRFCTARSSGHPARLPILSTQVHGKPLVYLDSASTSQKPEVVLDAFGRLLPPVQRERPSRDLRHRRTGHGGLRGGADPRRPVHQRARRPRDRLHSQRDRGDQPSLPTAGAAATSAGATRSS